jgi:hypothetical protein
MTDDERQRFKERYLDLSVDQLEALLTRPRPNQPPLSTEVRHILREMIEERRRAADAPKRERFEKVYEQTERHHREGKRSAWIAAVVSLIGAAAAWASVLFQTCHRSEPTAAHANPPAVTTPSPTP